MTFGNFILSSHSARWYLIGCGGALPDLLKRCSPITMKMWFFTLRVPFLIPFTLIAYSASFFLAERREVAIQATLLGVITSLGVQFCFNAHSSYLGFGVYVVCLAWFHFSEYFFTETCNPSKVKLSSFLLNHSPAYNIALASSVTEFLVERYFNPGMKQYCWLIFIGIVLCIFGDLIRKRAMWVAGPNFNHLVQYNLQEEPHKLVTDDVYGFIQHPSYTGWFIFTIGTQVILCNPFCGLAFPIVMYVFFEDRVRHEEPALAEKHGAKYELYKNSTPRFIPYIW